MVMQSLQQMSDSIRCGQHSIINIQRAKNSSLHPVDLEPWDMVLELQSVPRSDVRKKCVNIAGDGCFRMNMNEIATASRYNIPVIEVVLTTMYWVWCASGRPVLRTALFGYSTR